MAAFMGLKKSESRDSLSSGGCDGVMAISDDERELPCKEETSCVDEVMAFFGGAPSASSSSKQLPSTSSSSRKLVPVVSVCSSPGKSAKESDEMEDVQVDLQVFFTCRGLVLRTTAHVSHAYMQVLLLGCALMLRL